MSLLDSYLIRLPPRVAGLSSSSSDLYRYAFCNDQWWIHTGEP